MISGGSPFSRLDTVPVTGSTQDDLRAALTGPERASWPHLSALRALRQTAGRGRSGRAWVTPDDGGALLVSVVLRPLVPAQCLGWLPLLGGLAGRGALAPPAERRRLGSRALTVQVGDVHEAAGLDEASGDLRAESLRAARDQGDAAVDGALAGARGVRYPAPDVARGFMLLLIAVANVPSWNKMPNGAEPPVSSVDGWWMFVRTLVVDHRAYPLFAMLFGFGLMTMINRRIASGTETYLASLPGAPEGREPMPHDAAGARPRGAGPPTGRRSCRWIYLTLARGLQTSIRP